jgi:hypothetical protein
MKTSAAIRINAILEKALSNAENLSTQDAFAKILEIEKSDTHDAQDAVSNAIVKMRAEIRRVESMLKEKDTPKALRNLPIHAALNLTAPLQIAGLWQQNRGNHLRPEVMTAWGWIAFFLPSSEDDVTEEALKELELDLSELMAAAEVDGVPPLLRSFIIRQADNIREALRRYRVEGVEPLKEVISTGMGDLIRAEPTLSSVDMSSAQSASAFEKLGKTWNKVAKVAGEVKTVVTTYQALHKVVPSLLHLAEEGVKYLSS